MGEMDMKKTLPILLILIVSIILIVISQYKFVYGVNENNFLNNPVNENTEQIEANRINPGTVYFIRAVDTETSSGINPAIKNQEIISLLSGYNKTDPNSILSRVMSARFRNNLTDSFNNTMKYTWFVLTMEPYCVGNDSDCTIIYSALIDGIPNMGDYSGWKNEINMYKDDIEFHYHHIAWSDLNGDNISFWNQLTEFNNSNQYMIEKMLNHLLIDKNFFPSSYKGGWGWEDNGLSNFLEKYFPFDFTSVAPLHGEGCDYDPNNPKLVEGCEPFYNLFNWSMAPTDYYFYHPNISDYQARGNMSRMILKCKNTYSQREINQIFERAQTSNQLVCMYSHVDGGLIDETNNVYSRIVNASSNYNISFKFVSADEAARIYLSSRDITSPEINMRKENSSLIVESNEQIYQEKPYVAIKYRNNTYSNLELIKKNNYKWTYNLSLIRGSGYTIAVAITDPSGNVAVANRSFSLYGDSNCDRQINGLDVTYLVNYLNGRKQDGRVCPLATMDANGDCRINNLDVTYLVNYFKGNGNEPQVDRC